MLYIPYDYDLDHIVDLLVTYFFNRTDKISVQAPWESPCPAIPQDDLREILRNHVGGVESLNSEVLLKTSGGEFRFPGADLVGTYFPRPDGMVRVACVDFDNHGPSGGLLDPDNAAYDTADAADRFGLNPYLERSRSSRSGCPPTLSGKC